MIDLQYNMLKYLVIAENGKPFYIDVINKKITKQQKETINFFKKIHKDSKITFKVTKQNIFIGW